jgi:hypothetical protein
MKLKFRRGKPPLKIMEKGEQKPKLPKPSKQLVMDIVKEPEQQLLQLADICPLCLKPLPANNRHTVMFNLKPTTVHKTCP